MVFAAVADGADAKGKPPRPPSSSTGRSSLHLALSLIATALLGGAQAFALLVICGTDPRTEAFLAAYALYLPVAVLGASLRATVSALASRAPVSERGVAASEIVSRCVLFGAAVVGAMLVLTPLLAPVISGDLAADARATTTVALAILLPAAFLHIVAAALSGALGAHSQFGFSSAAYVVTGLISLGVSIAMLSAIGPLGAGVGVLTGTLLVSGAHVLRCRPFGIGVSLAPRRLRERVQWRITGEILTGAALGFALQANLAISISALDAKAGAITAYSYAFFIGTMILSLSSLPLGLVTLPGLVGDVQQRGQRAVADHIVRVAPHAYAIVLPLIAGFFGFGRPIVEWAFEPFVGDEVTGLLFDVARLLMLMMIPATLFYLASAASLPAATPQARLVAAGMTIALHAVAVAVAVAGAGGDPRAIAWAHAVAMLLSTMVLMTQVLRRRTLRTVASVVRAVVPTAVAATPILLVGLLVGENASAATIAVAMTLSAPAYIFVLHRLAPAVVEPFVALLRRPAVT